jgi:WD40 repeat protein
MSANDFCDDVRGYLAGLLVMAGVGGLPLMGCNPPTPPTLDNPKDGGGETIVYPPENVEVYASTYRSILLRWQVTSRNATGIVIERGVDGSPYQLHALTDPWINLYNDQTVNAFSIYHYRLRSTDRVGPGIPTPPVTAAYTLGDFSLRFSLSGLSGTVTSIAFEHLNTWLFLAAGDERGAVGIWRTLGYGSLVSLDTIGTAITSLQYSPVGTALAIAGADSTLRIGAGGTPWKLPSVAEAIAFSRDGQTIAVGLIAGVELYSVQGQFLRSLPLPRPAVITDLAFNLAGTMLVECWDDGVLRVWNTSDFSIRSEGTFQGIRTCEFTRDGNRIGAMNPTTGEVFFFSKDDLTLEWQFSNGLAPTSAFSLSPDNYICAAAGGTTVNLWKSLGKDGTPVSYAAPSNLSDLTFAHDGSLLVIGGSNGFLQVLNVSCRWQEVSLP